MHLRASFKNVLDDNWWIEQNGSRRTVAGLTCGHAVSVLQPDSQSWGNDTSQTHTTHTQTNKTYTPPSAGRKKVDFQLRRLEWLRKQMNHPGSMVSMARQQECVARMRHSEIHRKVVAAAVERDLGPYHVFTKDTDMTWIRLARKKMAWLVG